MERLTLISQALSLSVIFYVVTYFLITLQWPHTLLSINISIYFLYLIITRSVKSVPYMAWL